MFVCRERSRAESETVCKWKPAQSSSQGQLYWQQETLYIYIYMDRQVHWDEGRGNRGLRGVKWPPGNYLGGQTWYFAPPHPNFLERSIFWYTPTQNLSPSGCESLWWGCCEWMEGMADWLIDRLTDVCVTDEEVEHVGAGGCSDVRLVWRWAGLRRRPLLLRRVTDRSHCADRSSCVAITALT